MTSHINPSTMCPQPDQERLFKTYQLFIEIPEPVRVTVGLLGTFDFPAGLYVYTGSARRGFEARIRRHLGSVKKFHWHIDYLLAAKGVCVTHVERFTEGECSVNQRTQGGVVIHRFGASDCNAGCLSHLKRVDTIIFGN